MEKMAKDKVVIEIGGRYSNRLVRYYNPLELDNPQDEWIRDPILTGTNVLNPKNVIETDNNHKYWYNNIPEPGKNPYTQWFPGTGNRIRLSGSHREGEHFGNYMKVLSELVRCPVPYDRTDEFNMYNYLIDPIPKVPEGWNRTFEEVILERAEEIWKLGRSVRVWWSGGIDSTVVLISFLRTKKPEHELIVFMGDPCKEENPNFYETIRNMDDVKIQWNNPSNLWSFDNWTDGSINVTGEPGDPLYGTFVVENHIEEINSPWTDMLQWEDSCYMYKEDDYRLDYHRSRFMEFAEEYNKKCPFEIKNTFDFSWWLAFSIKWQWIVNRLYVQLPNPSKWDNMLSFYNFPEIQRWSIVNHDLKHKGSWKTYKWPSKEFIYNYNKDADYRDNKVKEKSIPKTAGMKSDTAQSHLLMSTGKFYKKIEDVNDGMFGLDPEILRLDKWDIFNKSVWKKWQTML